MRTTSSPWGRDASVAGYPLPVTEMLSLLPGVQYAARASVADPMHVGKAKAAKDDALAASLMEEVAQAKATIEAAGRDEAEAIARRSRGTAGFVGGKLLGGLLTLLFVPFAAWLAGTPL